MFKEYIQNQSFLVPPSMKDFLGLKHEAILLDDLIEGLDLTILYKQYSNNHGGSSAFHPKMLLKILFYGYMTQTFSSRKIAKKLRSDIAFMYLAGNNKPDFRTINRFRGERLKEVKNIFMQIVGMLKRLGVISFGLVSLDGTKIEANASKSRNYSEERLDNMMDKFLEEATKIDSEEDEELGDREDSIPEELGDPEIRKQRIKELIDETTKKKEIVKEEISKKEQQGIKQKKINLTDKDSRLMKMKQGNYANGYNAQIVSENQYILGTYVSNSASDVTELIPTIEEMEEKPKIIRADYGYPSTDNYDYLKGMGIDCYIPAKVELHIDLSKYKYNQEKDTYEDEEGNIYSFKQYTGVKGAKKGIPINRSEVRKGDYKSKVYITILPGGKRKKLEIFEKRREYHKEQREKVNTQLGKEIMNGRKTDVEPIFGNIKHNLNFRKLSLRSLEKVQVERNIISIVHNIGKMFISMT